MRFPYPLHVNRSSEYGGNKRKYLKNIHLAEFNNPAFLTLVNS